MERLGRLAVRARYLILIAAFLPIFAAGVVGGGVAERLSSGGFTDPGSESSQAAHLLHDRFDVAEANFVLVVGGPPGSTVDEPAVVRAGSALATRLSREPGVLRVTSYWSGSGMASLRSEDRRTALILAHLAGDDGAVQDVAHTLHGRYGDQDGLTVRSTGWAEVYREMTGIVEWDLVRAETFALPLTLLFLIGLFRTVVGASLPLAIGMIAVAGTLVVLWVISGLTDVSIFSLNMTTALGMGLAIDYGLLMVTRFREELAAGVDPDEAARRTVRTAGRTVVYSAATVAISLSALLVFPLYFLRSFAYAGIGVVAFAAATAVLVLPALLAVLGRRVDGLARRRRHRPAHSRVRCGLWENLATMVVRRPLAVAALTMLILVLLGLPFLAARFGMPDDRGLPPHSPSHQAAEVLRSDFASREAEPIFAVSAQRADAESLDAYARALSRIAGAVRVDTITGSYAAGVRVSPPAPAMAAVTSINGTWVSLVSNVESNSVEGQRLVREIRATAAPVPMLVGGRPAALLDSTQSIIDRLPLALGIVITAVGVLLFLFTGSLLVPLKAIVLNMLSLTATFGAMVWVFQQGHLRWLVGDFTVTGTLDITMPILMFCVAFGLSMDYEVFLLSRIREEWDRRADNVQAVVRGLGGTGRLITGAAIVMSIVFLAFATSGVTQLKLLGTGLALAVMVDATLVRGLLVPAFMRLAGRANWWAPRPLRALHDRFGFAESTMPHDAGGRPDPVIGPCSKIYSDRQRDANGRRGAADRLAASQVKTHRRSRIRV